MNKPTDRTDFNHPDWLGTAEYVRDGERLKPKKSAAMSYDEWRALGPEKAAEYTAMRMGYNNYRKQKLIMILKAFWNETKGQV